MNYQHLKYFQTVARRENYQLAAQELYISQPTLSRAIANLESELGVPLFEKHGRNIRITSFGRTFLQYVDQAIGNINEGVRCLRDMTNVMEGTITISAIYGFLYNQLPRLISDFNRQYPRVNFQIESGTSLDVIRKVHNGEFDLGFHCGTPKMQYYSDLDFYPLTTSELVIITSKMHRLAQVDEIYLKELSGEVFVSFNKDAGTYGFLEQLFARSKLPFSAQYVVSDDQGILNMVENNLAVSCIIQETVKKSDNVHVIRILDDAPKEVPIYITIKRKQHYPLILETFLQLIRNRYQCDEPVDPLLL